MKAVIGRRSEESSARETRESERQERGKRRREEDPLEPEEDLESARKSARQEIPKCKPVQSHLKSTLSAREGQRVQLSKALSAWLRKPGTAKEMDLKLDQKSGDPGA